MKKFFNIKYSIIVRFTLFYLNLFNFPLINELLVERRKENRLYKMMDKL